MNASLSEDGLTVESSSALADEHLCSNDPPLLEVRGLTVEYSSQRTRFEAVSDVSFDIMDGEVLGLVGESGCGKSTTGRAIVQLPRPTHGSVRFAGRELTTLNRRALRAERPHLQMIYQDPISSLNPRHTIRRVLEEPLLVWTNNTAAERRRAVDEMLEAVGISPGLSARRPPEFSGGQCQRIAIARALMLKPRLLVCDEPVSALDVSVQAQVLNLLDALKTSMGLAIAFISHDLAVVRGLCDRVMVMYLGKLCEIGTPDDLFESPAHPYTAALIAAIPSPDPWAKPPQAMLSGDVPSVVSPPSGCRFRTRCPRATELCAEETPQLAPVEGRDDHFVACHFPLTSRAMTRPDAHPNAEATVSRSE